MGACGRKCDKPVNCYVLTTYPTPKFYLCTPASASYIPESTPTMTHCNPMESATLMDAACMQPAYDRRQAAYRRMQAACRLHASPVGPRLKPISHRQHGQTLKASLFDLLASVVILARPSINSDFSLKITNRSFR